MQFLPDDMKIEALGDIEAEIITDEEVEKLLANLARAPLGIDPEEGFRISVAGAQEKTAPLFHEGVWKRPTGATPHIFSSRSWERHQWPDFGPIIFERQAAILRDQIEDARARGARIPTGGEIETHGGGRWLRPTVIADVDHDIALMHQETFDPILPVMTFDDEAEAVRLANDGEYGLSGAAFAADIDTAAHVGRRIEANAISLNDAALTTLFYEADKQSFKAADSRIGADGLGRFLRRKALIANTPPLPLQAFAEDAA